MGYKDIAETLARLEFMIHSLTNENHELREKLNRVDSESAALVAENQTIRHALEVEKSAREQALARMDALIGRIEGQIGVERLS